MSKLVNGELINEVGDVLVVKNDVCIQEPIYEDGEQIQEGIWGDSYHDVVFIPDDNKDFMVVREQETTSYTSIHWSEVCEFWYPSNTEYDERRFVLLE